MKRATIASAGLATGAVVAGLAGRSVWRRRHRAGDDGAWAPPPEDLGTVGSFDGTRLAVRAVGPADGPVLLFSHGFSLDMTTWREQWADLADGFRCVFLDHRAHGRSSVPENGDVTIRAMGRDLASVLGSLAPDAPVVAIGHSIGGIAFLALADEHPELFGSRIVGLALIGGAAADLLGGAMGGVTELLRPRLGSLTTAARRMDRLRRTILAGPADVSAIVARLTQFAPDAPEELVAHVLQLAAGSPTPKTTCVRPRASPQRVQPAASAATSTSERVTRLPRASRRSASSLGRTPSARTRAAPGSGGRGARASPCVRPPRRRRAGRGADGR
ncbi:MAG TPA: alpha/beta hydrolase, partial [Actinomycetota bacterium]|nr:alpha/beta hydrolase [Actinomycetota bacterium]